MAYSAILGQTPEIPDPTPPTAAQVSYNRSASSAVISSTNVQGAIDDLAEYAQDLFQSVSNGKNQIASAITGKGVSASGSESFASLAGKIGQIPTPQIASDTFIVQADGRGNFTIPPLGRLPTRVLMIAIRPWKEGYQWNSPGHSSNRALFYARFMDYTLPNPIDSRLYYRDMENKANPNTGISSMPISQETWRDQGFTYSVARLGPYYYENSQVLVFVTYA